MIKPSSQTSLFRIQPPLTSFSMFENNFRPSLSHFSSFATGQFVCHSLSALSQKLICNLFVLDQKFVLDRQVMSQISSVLFNYLVQCTFALFYSPYVCVCVCVWVCVCVCVHVCVCDCFHIMGVWRVPSMEQAMLTHGEHLLMTWLKLPSNQLGGGFWSGKIHWILG